LEAVKTNILGVSNVVEAALKARVSILITVSTDKAVKPVNVMGMSKAIQERLVISANLSPLNKGTKLCCVRYGNVMRSRGSVIPFFRRQLSLNEILTITDEQMTRFLLTLGDAIDLVMFATSNMEGGEVYVRKAPAARIVDMARILSEDKGDYFRINPWWNRSVFNELAREFCSANEVLENDTDIRHLIERSDREFEHVSVEEGEFSRI